MIIVQFIALVAALSALGLVLVAPWVSKLPDRGIGFYPTVGLVAVTLPSYWIGHLPGPGTGPITSWLLYFLAFGIAILIVRKKSLSLSSFSVPKIYIFVHLAVWFTLFFSYLLLRRHAPDIFGIEKLPDFAFLNSIYTYGTLPPENLFASDQVINYYYIGFFKTATLAWMAFLKSNEVFHLMTSYVLATCATTILSGCIYFSSEFLPNIQTRRNQILAIAAGLVAIIFAHLIGNSHTFYYYFISPTTHFWYPDATRYIANTIHEFPLYSYLIGDLHAHLLDLPNTVLAPLLIYLFSKKLIHAKGDIFKFLYDNTVFISVLGISFGLSYTTNSWNIFTNLLLIGFVTWLYFGSTGLFKFNTLWRTGLMSAVYIASAVIWFLPFWVNFKPITEGVMMTPPDKSSPTVQLIIIWFVHLLVPMCWVISHKAKEEVSKFFKIWLGLSLGLIVFMEFFYFKDIYLGHIRSNTMFKIGLQVWLWLSMLTGLMGVQLLVNGETKFKKLIPIALIAGGVLIGGTFSARAIPQYLDSVKPLGGSLEGMDFIKKKNPDLTAALDWLRENNTSRVVLLSAVADSFSEGGVVNAFSGLPTLVTWFNHVWLWNGAPDKQMKPLSKIAREQNTQDALNTRRKDAETVYVSHNSYDTKVVIKKYGIRYVYVSPIERKIYPALNEEKLNSMAKPVFKQGTITIYDFGQP